VVRESGGVKVTLRDGPCDGVEVEVSWGNPLAVEGDPVPEGMIARYRPTRERGVYRFREYDRIVGRLNLRTGEVTR
jgi:hypothetical protein